MKTALILLLLLVARPKGDLQASGFEFTGKRKYNLQESLRKFANKNVLLIAKALKNDSGLTLGDLRDVTGLSTSALNHALYDMKNADLVIVDNRRYYLTRYSIVLLDTLDKLRHNIIEINDDELFLPVSP